VKVCYTYDRFIEMYRRKIMHINWYPGHMKKTKDLIRENLKLIDVVIELLDSRIPISSKNPVIDELIGDKMRVVILNKHDLCDQKTLQEWIEYYGDKGIKAIPVNSLTGAGLNRVIHEVKAMAQPAIDKMVARGRRPRPVRVMIVGIPNVGKSSLINKLVGKKSAKTGNKPGVTKGKQWIRIRPDLELFDTPGILWPKIDDNTAGLNLAFTGAIRDEILDIEELCYMFVKELALRYPKLLQERYKLEEISEDPLVNLDAIATKRGCIARGKEIDYNKVSKLIFDEFRKGVIGHITLERPQDLKARDR